MPNTPEQTAELVAKKLTGRGFIVDNMKTNAREHHLARGGVVVWYVDKNCPPHSPFGTYPDLPTP